MATLHVLHVRTVGYLTVGFLAWHTTRSITGAAVITVVVNLLYYFGDMRDD